MRPRINSEAKLNRIYNLNRKLNNELREINSKISILEENLKKVTFNKKKIAEIEKEYRNKNLLPQLKFHSDYNELKDFIKINSQDTLRDYEMHIITLNQSIRKNTENSIEIKKRIAEQKSLEIKTENNTQEAINRLKLILTPREKTLNNDPKNKLEIEVEWKNISFRNGFIEFSYKYNIYKHFVKNSINCLNQIKHYYSFHNVPKLKIQIEGNSIIKIINEEVLFFNIDFLTVVGSNFGFVKIENLEITRWLKYNKDYYRIKLPYVMHTFTLKKLCEFSNTNLPIIPVAEVVINSSSSKQIHNSFLFIFKNQREFVAVWESVQESKASYVFSLGDLRTKDVRIQNIFNYIVGETINKRNLLINNKKLKSELYLLNRIYHSDFEMWKRSVHKAVN